MLDSCHQSSVPHFVFASSGAVYVSTDELCTEESTCLQPLEVYGESKLSGEQMVRAFHESTGISTTILRLFNAIGRNETNPHVVPHIFESLQRADVISLGNMAPRRDYIDTRDVADAIVAVAESPRRSRVYNVGTGVAVSVEDLLVMLRRILGRPIEVVQEPSRLRPSERMVLAADIRKIHRETGWTPRLSLDDTLRDLVEAYRLETQPHSAT